MPFSVPKSDSEVVEAARGPRVKAEVVESRGSAAERVKREIYCWTWVGLCDPCLQRAFVRHPLLLYRLPISSEQPLLHRCLEVHEFAIAVRHR